MSIAFSAVHWLAGKVARRGLCTTQLETLVAAPETPKPSVKFSLKPATEFTLPEDQTRPLIMIGPGTGVAPFMGFIATRQAARKTQGAAAVGKTLLYFGCRHADQDWIYREEMEAAVADGTLDKLRTAFSRAGPTKVYVQHRLEEDQADIQKLLMEQGAYLFVCGDGMHMAKDVHAALVRVLSPACAGSAVLAEDLLRALKQQGRYVQDIWS